MSILQNKNFAKLTMILMIIVAILIGSHNSLTKLSDKAEAVFYEGINGDGLCIQSDLDKRSELARNLVTVSSAYVPQDSPLLKNVESARSELKSASDIDDKFDANNTLDEAVFNLYSTLEKEGITQKEELLNNFSKNPTRIYTEFRSFGDTIKHDKYNSCANEFNSALKVFPANILSKFTFVNSLQLFE